MPGHKAGTQAAVAAREDGRGTTTHCGQGGSNATRDRDRDANRCEHVSFSHTSHFAAPGRREAHVAVAARERTSAAPRQRGGEAATAQRAARQASEDVDGTPACLSARGQSSALHHYRAIDRGRTDRGRTRKFARFRSRARPRGRGVQRFSSVQRSTGTGFYPCFVLR